MTHDKLREAVALAICYANGTHCFDNKCYAGKSCQNKGADCKTEADAALAAIREMGYAIVPVEPTEAMENAACGDLCRMVHDQVEDPLICSSIWRIMLKAAQEGKP
jgi:hypothetical protein